MSDQNAREQIKDLFANYTGEGDPASEVLAIVREALLSHRVASDLAGNISNGSGQVVFLYTAQSYLESAIDIAFGADDE